MTGLLASGPPLVEPAPKVAAVSQPAEAAIGDAAPLTVPSGPTPSPASGPALQRQFADRSTTSPLATSTAGSPAPSSGASTSTPESVPDGARGSVRPWSAGLDDTGYPPLIARSVQRSTVGAADAGRTGASTAAAADSPASSMSPEAPLSGFTAAISALQGHPLGPPLRGDVGRPVDSLPAGHDPALVVARRTAPDETGQLPAADVRLQRAVRAAGHLGSRPALVQRDLIAGRSPLVSPAETPGGGAPPAPSPAVQRLRYEDVDAAERKSPDLRAAGRSRRPAEHRRRRRSPGHADADLGSRVVSADTPAAPGGSAGWSSLARAGASGSPRSSTLPATVQRTATETSRPAAGTTTYPLVGAPPASTVIPPLPGSEPPPPMIQRHFDRPSPRTTVTPPASADPPDMGVSSRTVGLAEMFALAAGQSSAGEATIQRSAETGVQRADDPPAPAPTAAPPAAPAGPAGHR